MKYSNLLLAILLILIGIGIAFGLSERTNAQEGVVQFLEERFKELSIPITEITVLDESPLYLQITLRGATEWVTWEDTMNLHVADRVVFISARQHGYAVDRLAKILLDNQGKQIYYVDDSFNAELMVVDASPSILSDEVTKELVADQVDLLLDKPNLRGTLTAVDISSSDGLQTLDIQVIVPSLEEANRTAFLLRSLPYIPLVADINAQGAQIVFCKAEMKDQNGKPLLNFMYDFQLHSGSWQQDENLADLSFGHPLPAPTESPTDLSTPTPLPTATITPTP